MARGADSLRDCRRRLGSTLTGLSFNPLQHRHVPDGTRPPTRLLTIRAPKFVIQRVGYELRGSTDRFAQRKRSGLREAATGISRRS